MRDRRGRLLLAETPKQLLSIYYAYGVLRPRFSEDTLVPGQEFDVGDVIS